MPEMDVEPEVSSAQSECKHLIPGMDVEPEVPIITTKAYKGVLAAINEHSSAVDILDNLEEV